VVQVGEIRGETKAVSRSPGGKDLRLGKLPTRPTKTIRRAANENSGCWGGDATREKRKVDERQGRGFYSQVRRLKKGQTRPIVSDTKDHEAGDHKKNVRGGGSSRPKTLESG